jgi:hypothetical protein
VREAAALQPSGWLKGIAQWRIGKTLYLSVPFTWLLPEARLLASAHKGPVRAGGPAVALMPDYLAGVAEVNRPCPIEPLLFHNPLATFTTRGCPNACGFCAVPRLEGGFRELDDWRLAPLICDNNLLASSRRHFDRVIDRLKALPGVDFNQGLDARLITARHASRIAELKNVKVRFAFDHPGQETAVHDAIALCRREGLRDFSVYCLIGFDDDPESAKHRLSLVLSWKAWPNPMRYQPLDSLVKNSHVAPGWTDAELKRFMCYYSRQRYLSGVPFDEYDYIARRGPSRPQNRLF